LGENNLFRTCLLTAKEVESRGKRKGRKGKTEKEWPSREKELSKIWTGENKWGSLIKRKRKRKESSATPREHHATNKRAKNLPREKRVYSELRIEAGTRSGLGKKYSENANFCEKLSSQRVRGGGLYI